MTREVWITGCGLLSALGNDLETTWDGLHDAVAVAASGRGDLIPPFTVHPLRTPLQYDRYIPKRGDQRAMGPTMLMGCVAAGQALDEAGILGNGTLLKRTHLLVGVGGGERDEAADEQILAALDNRADYGPVLAERLQADLRPTLFLAQLPNLFAGNISIVLGVSGSSRTFMGEEAAGLDALRIAHRRITCGQADAYLVGGANNAVRHDYAVLFGGAHYLLTGPTTPFWDREQCGMTLGTMGAFLMMEAREHAEARGAKPLARLSGIESDRVHRTSGSAAATATRQWRSLNIADGTPVISGASGIRSITIEEHGFLAKHTATVRAPAAAFGHGIECAPFADLVLAVKAIKEGRLFPALTDDVLEGPTSAPVTAVAVTSWGHRRGEGLALVEAV